MLAVIGEGFTSLGIQAGQLLATCHPRRADSLQGHGFSSFTGRAFVLSKMSRGALDFPWDRHDLDIWVSVAVAPGDGRTYLLHFIMNS